MHVDDPAPTAGRTAGSDASPVRPRAARGVPIALTVAGSDSGGGAGIQADLKTFAALGVHGASALTAVTAQDTRRVSAVHEIPPDIVAAQLRAVLDDLDVAAVKIGMLSSVAIIETVADVLAARADLPVVLDPVMVAKGGDRLLRPEAHAALATRLGPLARVLTPNVPEAAILLGEPEARDEATLAAQARRLAARSGAAVLLKGGHLHGATSVDVLCADGDIRRLERPRVATGNTHGTGCTLSAAIAAALARGLSLEEAIDTAGSYVHAAIARADELRVGHGHGPVHHFHHWWPASA